MERLENGRICINEVEAKVSLTRLFLRPIRGAWASTRDFGTTRRGKVTP